MDDFRVIEIDSCLLSKVAAYYKYKFDVMFVGDDHQQEAIYIRDAARLKKEYGVDTIYIKRSNVSSTEIRKRIYNMRVEE